MLGSFRSASLIVASLGLMVCSPAFAQDSKPDKKLQENFELMRTFAETFEQIEKNYVKDIDRRELMEAAIQGMLQRLDPYSSYIPRERLDRFNESVEQEYGGVGIQVVLDPRNNRLRVVTPLPGGPAYFKGVRSGAYIMEIEGESTVGFYVTDAVERLKGPTGGEVTIGLLRAGSPPDSPLDQVTLVRDIVKVDTVRGDKFVDGKWDFLLDKENKIAYMRLTHFSRHSADEMKAALEMLKDQGMKGLILDLRNNPGGLLRQATAICDMYIEKGKIVSTEGRNVPKQTWRAKKQGTYVGFPMVVLVNGISASASEIVSACLQDSERAKIIGERTWGKGSVQNVINLDSGKSALKLTTASYFRPSGRNIHRFPDSKSDDEWGVTPDDGFLVSTTPKERMQLRLNRRDRDIIENKEAPEATKVEDVEDRQLNRAVSYLKKELGVADEAEKSK